MQNDDVFLSSSDTSYKVGRKIYIFDDVLDVLDDHNKKILYYSDDKFSECYSDYKSFHYPTLNKKEQTGNYSRSLFEDVDFKNKDILDSLKRSINIIRDIIFLNDCFKYFVTLTLDKEVINRTSVTEVRDKMKKLLNNLSTRKKLKYLLVPELHKDGGIHFHGLINDVLTLTDSQTRYVRGFKNPVKISNLKKYKISDDQVMWDRPIYNINEFTLGFSTAIPLYGEKVGVTSYVLKYITKYQEDLKDKLIESSLNNQIIDYENQIHKIFGKRFWSSKGLERFPKVKFESVSYDKFDNIDSKVYYDSINRVSLKYKNNLDYKEVL